MSYNHDLLRARIDEGFNVNEMLPSKRRYPLYLACQVGATECAEILIAAGAHVDSKSDLGHTPLYRACYSKAHGCIKLLLKAGADVNATTISDKTPLHAACYKNDMEAVRLLLEAGADPAAVDDEGALPQDLSSRPDIKELIYSCMGGYSTKSAL